MANFFLAFEQDVAIVPILNKVDLTSAEPERIAQQMKQVWSCGDCIECSVDWKVQNSWNDWVQNS